MTDEPPFYTPGLMPKAREPMPSEHLWSVYKVGQTRRAVLRYHGAGIGVELQLLADGEFLYGRRYPSRADAVAAAALELARRRRSGWTLDRQGAR